MSESIFEQAKRFELIGEWEKAKEIIQEELNSNLTNEEKAKLQVILSNILLRQADFNRVKQLLESAEEVAKEVNNKKLLGDIYYNFGELAYINSFLREIVEKEEALKIFEAIIEFSKPIDFIIPLKIVKDQIEKIKQKGT
ncbi:MAG: hypothetical protein ACTSPC_08820 [Candidatus Heimdallarchaeota archaeon]